ncbi:hypothetical protein AB0H12_22855 [Actinosynnema sp. NPDC023794]
MANTLPDWGPPLRADGVIREPHGDRRSACVHEADIAAVAATALTTDGHAGQTNTLTGPEALTPRDKVRHLADATGRDLRFEEHTPQQARALWTAEPPSPQIYRVAPGGPAEKADFVIGLYANVPESGATVTDVVERVTGRPARTYAQWAVEHADAFRG